MSADDQDRAVARRVLRRHVAAWINASNMRVDRHEPRFCSRAIEVVYGIDGRRSLSVRSTEFDAAVDGARAGREYRAKEIKRDADAAHARVEGHMLDRQIAQALR